ncbi:MAG: MBL fold metallo-hydrolase, partial [Pseudomonadota bacterium]
HQVLLVERPRLEFAYDTDPKMSAETRVRMLDMLAANRIPVIAFHFPWPGVGHFAKRGDGFRYLAQPMDLS